MLGPCGLNHSAGWGGPVYYRLHGSPKVYDSAYRDLYLETLAMTPSLAAKSAAFAATENAGDVLDRLRA